MATRSTIAVIHADGTVSQVYCHWDGYLAHNGKLLIENYATQELAESLISLGDISSLGSVVGEKHPFSQFDCDSKDPFEQRRVQDEYNLAKDLGWTTYYGRDRGETDIEPKKFANVYEYLDKLIPEEYNYLFNGTSWGYQAYDMMEYVEVTSDLIEQEMA